METNLKKIVYVEDDQDIRTIGEMSLQMGHWQIICCDSGLEAIKMAHQEVPDLLIMDVMMPGMDGISTLKILQTDPLMAQIPVIFMTAKVQFDEINKFKKLGIIDVIRKPFDPMLLATQVTKIWESITKIPSPSPKSTV